MIGLIVLLYLAGLSAGALLFFNAMQFLWHGGRYFAAVRRELRKHAVCGQCGAPATRPGAGFCGKCGGRIQRAA